MIDQNRFREFLGFTISSKDVSLVIAKDDSELKEFVVELKNDQYRYLKDIWEIMDFAENSGKGCFAMDDTLEKELYDFVIQYPTGQVEIWDEARNDFRVSNPKYEDVSLVFLITKQDLENIKKQGFEILSKVGLAYQEFTPSNNFK